MTTNVRIDDDKVFEILSANPTLSNRAVADQVGCDEASVRRSLERLKRDRGFQRHLIPVLDGDRFSFSLDTPIVVRNTNAMVTADWHVPLYDPAYVNEMIERARALEIRTLVIAGDFFNFDALSAYDPKQESATLTREYNEALAVMRVLAESFDTIYYLWGNHDARMHRALGYAMKFRDAMRMVFGALGDEILEKLVFTNLDHIWFEFDQADGEVSRWYLCHPANYSRVPLSNARQLAVKYNANVITAHSHHAAIGYAVNGEYTAAEGGGLFDKDKTAYLQRSTTFPTWQQGYGWFLDGRFTLTTPHWEAGAYTVCSRD